MKKALQLKILLLFLLCSSNGISQSLSSEEGDRLLSKRFEKTNIEWKIEKEHVSSTSGIRHVYYSQLLNGIPILGTNSSIHIDKNGGVVADYRRFLSLGAVRTTNDPIAAVSSSEALINALKHLQLKNDSGYQLLSPGSSKEKAALVSSTDISEESNTATLKYILTPEKELRLLWEFLILEADETHFWNIQMDATDGTFIEKQDQVKTCAYENDSSEELNYNANLFDIPNYKKEEAIILPVTCTNCYEVFEFPMENPYFGDRTIVESPHYVGASPYGWHDTNGLAGAEELTTEGNNIIAFEGGDNYGYNPDVSGDLNFVGYEYDPIFVPSNQSEEASLTNVFYWMNIFHDISYVYGFDEMAGNHQFNNYGNGSSAYQNDPLIVTVQSPLDACNAQYLNFPDGVSSKIRLYLCNTKDGSFDSTILLHEYAHAVSIRLESVGSTTCGGNDENPNEGWSDWYALMLTMTETDTADRPRAIGAYLKSQGINGGGFRPYPYSTDLEINPQTFEFLQAGMGRHGVGSIWASILWEVSWGIIDKYGFDPDLYNFTGDVNQDAGNIMMLAIATEALKLTPCVPGFIDSRDAMLSAAKNIYGSEVECDLWQHFAKRGLGFEATSGSTAVVGDEIASYNYEAGLGLFDLELPPVCEVGGLITDLSGGFPVGGIYSGPGITDNGDGRSFNFDPGVVGVGEYIATYTLEETDCYPGSITTTVLTVQADTVPPIVECYGPIIHRLHASLDLYEVPDFRENTFITDECSSNLIITQNPPVGTMIEPGTINVIFNAEDERGNNASCGFELTVERKFFSDPELPDHLNDDLALLPNPSNGNLTLNNPYVYRINHWEVRDIMGRFVYRQPVDRADVAVPVNLESLAAGMYFVRVDYKRTARTFRIVIE